MLKNKSLILVLVVMLLALFCASCEQTVVVVSGTFALTQWKTGSTLEFRGDKAFTVSFDSGSPCDPATDHLDGKQESNDPSAPFVASCKVAKVDDYSENFVYTITGPGASRATLGIGNANGLGTIPCTNCKTKSNPTQILKPTLSDITSIGIVCNVKTKTFTVGDGGNPPSATPGSMVTWTPFGPNTEPSITFENPTACSVGSTNPPSCVVGQVPTGLYAYTVAWPACTGDGNTPVKSSLQINSNAK